MASPPLSPTLTAHPHRKRRHSEIVEFHLSADTNNNHTTDNTSHLLPLDEATLQAFDEQNGDEAYDSDSESVFEELADQAEIEPYVGYGPEAVSADQGSQLRRRLLDRGLEAFINDVLLRPETNTRRIGTAFGIDPNLDVDEEAYMRVLLITLRREATKRQKLPQYNDINDAAYLVRKSHNIIVITGAGISTSLGIPDFRSKEGGFYTELKEVHGIDEPQLVFDLHEFDQDPSLFYSLAGKILPTMKEWSPTHQFIKLLQDRNRLQTNYTQNIDNLEASAGIDPQRLIQCHGSFATATCRKCGHKVRGDTLFEDIRKKRVSHCKVCTASLQQQKENAPKRNKSRPVARDFDGPSDDEDEDDDIPEPGVMKPDITFFHEKLGDPFFDRLEHRDAKQADLVIVIGTSLKVAPVSEIPNFLPHEVPHIYISNESIKHVNFDIQLLGQCDDVVTELCNRIGGPEWKLRHKMIPSDFKCRVTMEDENPSLWRIVRDRSRRKERLEAPFGHPLGARLSLSPMRQRASPSPMRQKERASASPMRQGMVQRQPPSPEYQRRW